jgi:ElaB/YqjD/DUF883 family membrane-anchored ribosome-binding protein
MNTITPERRSTSDSQFTGANRRLSANSGRDARRRDHADKTRDLAVSKNQLIADFKNLVADAEEMLRSTSNLTDAAVTAARSKFEKQWAQAKIKLDNAQNHITEYERQATTFTKHYVRDHPWTAAGVAGGIGLVVGLLLSRRF